MKLFYKKNLILFFVAAAGFCCMDYSSGPALGGLSVTGASFGTYGAGTYCNACHSGGNYSPTVNIDLLSNGVPVTGNYVPGWNYTLRITRSASASLPLTGGFGFQLTCVNDATNANINTWGTPPAGTALRTLSSRNYIEHTAKMSKEISQIDIPWTAPAAGTGTVRFYLALNTVNGNGANTGDQPISTSKAFTQAPLPVTWLYFRGRPQQNGNLLEWAASNEVDNHHYRVQKSRDGISYEDLALVIPTKSPEFVHQYSWIDTEPYDNTFYRIAQVDHNGDMHLYKTIQIVKDPSREVICYVHGDVKIDLPSAEARQVSVALYDLAGRKVRELQEAIPAGAGRLVLERPAIDGVYIVAIQDDAGLMFRSKILVQ